MVRQAMLAKAAGHNPNAKMLIQWKQGTVHQPAPAVAIVTNRVVETIRTTPPATYGPSASCTGSKAWTTSHSMSAHE